MLSVMVLVVALELVLLLKNLSLLFLVAVVSS